MTPTWPMRFPKSKLTYNEPNARRGGGALGMLCILKRTRFQHLSETMAKIGQKCYFWVIAPGPRPWGKVGRSNFFIYMGPNVDLDSIPP